MVGRYSLTMSQNLRISTPPGIEPGPPGQRTTLLATSLYRRGQITCPTGRTGGAATLHGVSQPSPGFELPLPACETRRIPFIFRDDTSLHYHLTNIYRVSPHCWSWETTQEREGMSKHSCPPLLVTRLANQPTRERGEEGKRHAASLVPLPLCARGTEVQVPTPQRRSKTS